MNISRREKFLHNNSKVNKSGKTININLDISTLDVICLYVLSNNRNIQRSHFINLRNLMSIINMENYVLDPEKMKRIEFINKGLNARLNLGLNEPNIIIKEINGGFIGEQLLDLDLEENKLSNQELAWINNMVSESLKYSFIYNDIDDLLEIATRFKSEQYGSRAAIVAELENKISEMQTKFRRVKAESASEAMFSLREGTFENVVSDTYNNVVNPSSRLLCGMQGVNELTSGGFASGRVYMLFGLPGEGKSMTLLNLAYQIKKYNKTFQTKDPTKIPCIVLLTMENSVRETVERLFGLAGQNDEMKNYSVDQVINLLRRDGELYLTEESPIDIIIKYKPGNTVDTGYLYELTEDLEDEGYEVICMIQDYVKKIKSCYHHADIRLELGSIIDEFKVYATIKDVPVITASQLNRGAVKSIDEGKRLNKADLVRLLGRDNIGESMLMLENTDCSILLAVEYDANGNKYLGLQRTKMREKSISNRTVIYHPFVKGNGIKLIEDFYSAVPVFKETLREMNFNNGTNQNRPVMNNIKPSSYSINEIKNFDEVFEREDTLFKEDNIFGKMYNFMNTKEEEKATIDYETMPVASAGVRSESNVTSLINPITIDMVS